MTDWYIHGCSRVVWPLAQYLSDQRDLDLTIKGAKITRESLEKVRGLEGLRVVNASVIPTLIPTHRRS